MRPDSRSDELIPPLGLGYLITAVRKNHEVDLLDGIKDKLTLERFGEILKKNQYDVIGIQIFTFQIARARDYVRKIRELLPGAKIILGGPHPSCASQNIFEFFPQIDWAFRGEAEVGLASFWTL